MTEVKEEYSLSDTFQGIRSFVSYLKSKWWAFGLVALIGVSLGVLYYTIQKPKYEAVCTFVLEEKSVGGGGLAGLASQFGFNVGSLSSEGSLFTGDNILNILKSKKIVEQVLLTPATDNASDKATMTLADLYIDFTGMKDKWIKNSRVGAVNFFANRDQITSIQDSLLNEIYKSIVKKSLNTERSSKQGTIISVQVSAPNALFARLMTERLVTEASKMYLNIRVGTALANIGQLQRRSDSLLLLLNHKSFAAAATQPLDINPGIKTAIVPVEIANRDKSVLATLYAEVTKNLEASKLILSQQTPVIQILDRPGYLLEDNKKGLVFLVIVFAFGFILLYTSLSFILFLLKFKSGRL